MSDTEVNNPQDTQATKDPFSRNGLNDDEDDIFKSALESPITENEKQSFGEQEIDLNDDDDLVEVSEDRRQSNGDRLESSNGPTLPPVSVTEETPAAAISSTIVPSTLESAGKEKASSNATPEESSLPELSEGGDQMMEITITEPQKQGEGISTFMVYRVTTRTNISLFRRREFAVWRRFSDFLGLHMKLSMKHSKKGRIVPPAPEKKLLGTTKIKMAGQEGANTATNGTDFIEKRRAELERFMNRIASHPFLRIDPDFKDFLENDSDLPKATSTSALSGAGVARLFNKVGETMNKISYRMDETDPWFEEKIQNIEALETQLRKVHASVELLVYHRRDLAQATGNFSKSAAILSYAEEHTGLARALAQLSEVEDKVEQLHHEQANSDFFMFSELLKDYIYLIGSVKEVFYERVKCFQSWQHAQQTLNKKRESKNKMESLGKTERMAQIREEVVEWEGKSERFQEDFNSISEVIKKEFEQFEKQRVKEFKKIIIKYLESLLTHQNELVKHWEAFLPEAKAIAIP